MATNCQCALESSGSDEEHVSTSSASQPGCPCLEVALKGATDIYDIGCRDEIHSHICYKQYGFFIVHCAAKISRFIKRLTHRSASSNLAYSGKEDYGHYTVGRGSIWFPLPLLQLGRNVRPWRGGKPSNVSLQTVRGAVTLWRVSQLHRPNIGFGHAETKA